MKTHYDIIYEIAKNHLQCLLETHLQAIEKIHKLRPTFLKIYLKIIEKHSLNNLDNLLTHHIYGISTSFNSLKKNVALRNLFFQEVDNIGTLQLGLLESYLQNVYILCNFFSPPSMIERYLIVSSRIFNLQLPIFETHLNNLNSISLPLLKEYINTVFQLENNLQTLILYIESTHILKKRYNLIETHQQNTKAIYAHQFPILNAYFTLISHLAQSNSCSLGDCIQGVKKISSNQTVLQKYFQIIGIICRLKPDLLDLHLQNMCKLSQVHLENYIQTIYIERTFINYAVHCMHNTIHLSSLQPGLLNLHFSLLDKWKNNQINKFNYSYNIYHLIQNNLESLPMYLDTVLFLEKNYPNLSKIHLENINKISINNSDFLKEYLSTIRENIGIEKGSFLLFYIRKTYNIYIVAEKYSELTDLYYDAYEALEDVQENILCYVCNFLFISQNLPNLIKIYLESTLSLREKKLYLSQLHLQNIKNICCSNPLLLNKYLLKILHYKDNQTQLMLHIQNTYNRYTYTTS